jgi:hypothetical protein
MIQRKCIMQFIANGRFGGALPNFCLGLVLALVPLPAVALPLLSEVFYDAAGSDNGLGFVEIHGEPGLSLAGFTIEGVNGANGVVTVTLTLVGTIPEDGIFLLADDAGDGSSLVVGADLVLNFDFQNGPDGIALRSNSVVVDAIGYGVFGPSEFFAGEGAPAPDVPAGSSLARRFANVDTDDNAADWVALTTPTPGFAPLQSVPEPTAGALLALGLVAIASRARWKCAAR